jgi:nitric oxide reductase large subunit
MAMRQYVFLTLVLILLILTAGCSDTSSEAPPLPTMSTLPVSGDKIQEGQILQSIGNVTGQGIPGGTIDTITFTVGLIDNHKSVDMEQLTIVYADAIMAIPRRASGASTAWKTRWEVLITGSIMKSGSSSGSTQKLPSFPGR